MLKNRIDRFFSGGSFGSIALVALIYAVVSKVLSVLAGIVIARKLGPVELGLYGLSLASLQGFGAIAAYGFSNVILRNYNAEGANKNMMTSVSVSLSLLFSFVAVFIYCMTEDVSRYTIVVSILIIQSGVASIGIAIMYASQKYSKANKLGLMNAVFSSLMTCLGAYLYGRMGALSGYAIGVMAATILNWYWIFDQGEVTKVSWCVKWTDVKAIFKDSTGAAVCSIALAPIVWWNYKLLTDSGYSYEAGYFNICNQIRNMLLFVPSSLTPSFIAYMSFLNHESKVGNLYHQTVLGFALITALAGFGVSVSSKFLLGYYKIESPLAEAAIYLISIVAVFQAAASAIGGMLLSAGNIWKAARLNIFCALLMMLFAYILVPRFGVIGVTSGLILANIIYVITLHFLGGKLNER
jgi:O-antigen/teichoic acid export membrane protein